MIKKLIFSILIIPSSLWAIYAPVPLEEEQNWTVHLVTKFEYDTNVLGSDNNEIDSWVWSFDPKISLNIPVTEQTKLTGWYQLNYKNYEDRGDNADETLLNHTIVAKVMHLFTPNVKLVLSEQFSSIDSPESTEFFNFKADQSYNLNDFNIILEQAIFEKSKLNFFYNNRDYDYKKKNLARTNNRNEHNFHISYFYKYQPELALFFQYRLNDTNYEMKKEISSGGESVNKNNESNYFIVGSEWQANTNTKVTSEFGIQNRNNREQKDEDSLYAKINIRHNYAQNSFIESTFKHEKRDSNSPTIYTDELVSSLNVKTVHNISDALIASAGFTFEDSTEEARQKGVRDRESESTRGGLALIWRPVILWEFNVNYDYDLTTFNKAFEESDERRHRFGITANHKFGID
jgi:hypothetical protein